MPRSGMSRSPLPSPVSGRATASHDMPMDDQESSRPPARWRSLHLSLQSSEPAQSPRLHVVRSEHSVGLDREASLLMGAGSARIVASVEDQQSGRACPLLNEAGALRDTGSRRIFGAPEMSGSVLAD